MELIKKNYIIEDGNPSKSGIYYTNVGDLNFIFEESRWTLCGELLENPQWYEETVEGSRENIGLGLEFIKRFSENHYDMLIAIGLGDETVGSRSMIMAHPYLSKEHIWALVKETASDLEKDKEVEEALDKKFQEDGNK